MRTDTIAAPATPPGRSSVAMLRVSGPDAFLVADRILRQRRSSCRDYATHTLHRASIVDGSDTVDDVLVAVFLCPRSYTGEDTVEITCHGGPIPVRRTMALLLRSGARMADPGEFTLRAFLNGKLDLAQAEAVNDTISARSDEAFRLAQAQQSGRLSAAVGALRDRLIGVTARIEATIDFPEDVGEFPVPWCQVELAEVRQALLRLIASAGRGMLIRDGVTVVLAGAPNAGKSSLLNALLRSDRAIVTDTPGTTRDSIEESVTIRGIPVRLVDTAGLRDARDEAERLGVERARGHLAAADIVLDVRDATQPLRDQAVATGARRIVVWNKIDLAPSPPLGRGEAAVSALTGQGIEDLESAIADTALSGAPEITDDSATVTHARHLHALEAAAQAVTRAEQTLDAGMPLDFLSIEAQSALSSLGLITGQTAPQQIVDEIFHRFCIGK